MLTYAIFLTLLLACNAAATAILWRRQRRLLESVDVIAQYLKVQGVRKEKSEADLYDKLAREVRQHFQMEDVPAGETGSEPRPFKPKVSL